MGRGRRTLVAGALVLGGLGAAACSDDDDGAAEDEVVTEADYASDVERLCAQHGPELTEELTNVDTGGASDADVVAFYQVDYIPRVRAVLEALADGGLPNERAADLLRIYNEINDQLTRLNSDPYGFIDRTRVGDPSNEGTLETFATSVNEDLATADIACLPAPNLA
jgi:hypothetical protein